MGEMATWNQKCAQTDQELAALNAECAAMYTDLSGTAPHTR